MPNRSFQTRLKMRAFMLSSTGLRRRRVARRAVVHTTIRPQVLILMTTRNTVFRLFLSKAS